MPADSPAGQQYLTVVSEWSSYGQSGVRVGNAFPIFCLSRGEVVADPIEVFPNPGGIFLVNRGECRVWDYVVTTPKINEQYRNKNFRDCYFVAFGAPEEYNPPPHECKAAVVLDVPHFNILTSDNVIRSPAQNVTPIFFIRDDQHRIFGPLKRTAVQLDSMERIGSIHWAPGGSESGVYEFTADKLAAQGCKLVEYEHPQPPNEVVHRPIRIIAGPVWKLTSMKVHDRLSDNQLAEWYLRLREIGDVPEPVLKTLRTAPERLQADTPDVVRRRFLRLMQLFGALEVMQTERQALARKYLESEDGKKAVAQQLAREVEQRAKELEAEVQRQRADLAREKKELAEQLELARTNHGKKVKELTEELARLERKRASAEQAAAALQASLKQGAEQLAERMQEELPLLAALGGGRVVVTHAAGPAPDGAPVAPVPAASTKPAWSSVEIPEPTRDLAPVSDEPALVDRLAEGLRAEGLYFTRDFVANLYVLLKSSALNLLIGPPGYGKSSVVAAMARVLGHGHALLEIAVRRSWSDDRHLLGFFDSFHGRFDPGPTGLATRLLQAQRDWEEHRRGIYMVLLDEFNLSAPEYYFSQLLQVATRPPEQPRVVRLFDAAALPAYAPDRVDQITLHPNVSFWGTINYDETTERLSPRLLDRTGMVFLTARDVLPGEGPTAASPTAKGVRAKEVCGALVRQPGQCPPALWEQIQPYLDLLGQASDEWGPRLELSPRVLTAVRRYLANADGVLAPVRAVDFVFQQRVLPVLRGRGPQYASRVRALEQKLAEGGLERSARHVSEAAAIAASQFGDIDFLAY